MSTQHTPLKSDKRTGEARPSSCIRFPKLHLVNKSTGEVVKLNCKSYKCPHCSQFKSRRLFSALNKYLSTWKQIRFFTFTFRTSLHEPREINRIASKIFAKFIKELRRNYSLSVNQRKVNYIKFVELTQRGYIHYHVIFDNYLPIQILLPMWQNAINSILNLVGKNGSINVKYVNNSKSVARYICKYVVKNALELHRYKQRGWIDYEQILRFWSKSNRVSIFDRPEPNGEWTLIIVPTELILNTFSLTVQDFSENSHLVTNLETPE